MYKITTDTKTTLIDAESFKFNDVMSVAHCLANLFPNKSLEIAWVVGKEETYIGCYNGDSKSWKFWEDVLEFIN